MGERMNILETRHGRMMVRPGQDLISANLALHGHYEWDDDENGIYETMMAVADDDDEDGEDGDDGGGGDVRLS